MERKKIVQLKGITKSFDGETVLKNIDLDIYDNEFMTILGPSGCGKTTTLRIIAGFETPESGEVYFDGEKINDLPPYKRPINTVFQRYALFPHLNVYENVAFGLRVAKVSDAEISVELSEKQIKNMRKTIPIGVIRYGYLPLMITRNAPAGMNDACKNNQFLQVLPPHGGQQAQDSK